MFGVYEDGASLNRKGAMVRSIPSRDREGAVFAAKANN